MALTNIYMRMLTCEIGTGKKASDLSMKGKEFQETNTLSQF